MAIDPPEEPLPELLPWQQEILDRIIDGTSYREMTLESHFRARRAAKNRVAARWFAHQMMLGNHAHLIGVGFQVCTLTDPCANTTPYADWLRDHAPPPL